MAVLKRRNWSQGPQKGYKSASLAFVVFFHRGLLFVSSGVALFVRVLLLFPDVQRYALPPSRSNQAHGKRYEAERQVPLPDCAGHNPGSLLIYSARLRPLRLFS